MGANARVLIIDDEGPIRQVLSSVLQDEGYEVSLAEDGEKGLFAISQFQPQIVLLDIWMPGKFDGIEVLRQAKQLYPALDIVMMSGHGTIETAVKATKLGAWDFIEKPLSMDKLLVVLHNLLSLQQEKDAKINLLNRLRRNLALIGEHGDIVTIKEKIAHLAPKEGSVLILGEDGAGKSLVAQNLHYLSRRAGKSLVEINLANIPVDLQMTEIFGIEKGAMPGVDKPKKGKLELAQGGTLFLDEVSLLTKEVQRKLIQLTKAKSAIRVGGTLPYEVDVRLVFSCSNNLQKQNLDSLIEAELLDLMEGQIEVPPLRSHPTDVPSLVNHFGDGFVHDSGYPRKIFSDAAFKAMMDHGWPGNVRELKNFIERVYILTPSDYVDVHDLRFAGLELSGDEDAADSGTFREARAKFEKEYLVKKLNENSGNISKTAEIIGLERSYLHRKIKSYGIDVKGE